MHTGDVREWSYFSSCHCCCCREAFCCFRRWPCGCQYRRCCVVQLSGWRVCDAIGGDWLSVCLRRGLSGVCGSSGIGMSPCSICCSVLRWARWTGSSWNVLTCCGSEQQIDPMGSEILQIQGRVNKNSPPRQTKCCLVLHLRSFHFPRSLNTAATQSWPCR